MKAVSLFSVVILVSMASFSYKQQTPWKAPAEANKLINPLKDNASAAKTGENLFESQCSACHGTTGKGDGMAGANLSPKPTNLQLTMVRNQSDGAIFWKISTGKSPMPSFASLSKQQRWQLVDFIRKLETGTVTKKDVPSGGGMMMGGGGMLGH